MLKRKLFGLLLAVLMVVGLAATATAGPLYTMRTDEDGIPMILTSDSLVAAKLTVTSDGYVVTRGRDAHFVHRLEVLDPALESPNNAPVSAQETFIRITDPAPNYYDGSVPGGINTDDGNPLGDKGLTRPLPGDTFFGWHGGGVVSFREVQLQDSTGVYDATAGTAARITAGSQTVQGALHKDGLEMWDSAGDPDSWLVLGGMSGTGGIIKMEWGPLTDWTTTNAGWRTITGEGSGWLIGGSGNSRTSLIQDLVPGVGDTLREFAYNPYDGNLYVLTGTGDRSFLSALTFEWGDTEDDSVAEYVDLDPSSPNNYIELTYDSGDAFPNLTNAGGLGFSPDGSVLYVAHSDRVFIFDIDVVPESVPIPEPAGLSLLGMALLGLKRKRRR